MTQETGTASNAPGSNGGDSSDATNTRAYETSVSSSSYGGKGHGQGGCTVREIHQGREKRGGHFNQPTYTSSTRNLKGEVENFGAVLGTKSEKRVAKDQ